MKRCNACNDLAIYDDNIINCPICGTPLVAYQREQHAVTRQTNPQTPPLTRTQPRVNEPRGNGRTRQEPPQFETRSGMYYVYRGMVAEIRSQSRFHSRLKKIVNSLFRGEPYQLGNTSHETVFRLEEFTEARLNGRRRDLIFYGDVEGRFFVGDDVTVQAKRIGDRYIVCSMYLNDTGAPVRPAPQLPAAAVWLLMFLILALLAAVVYGVSAVIESGIIGDFVRRVLPTLIVVAVIIWWIRTRFFRRRR